MAGRRADLLSPSGQEKVLPLLLLHKHQMRLGAPPEEGLWLMGLCTANTQHEAITETIVVILLIAFHKGYYFVYSPTFAHCHSNSFAFWVFVVVVVF